MSRQVGLSYGTAIDDYQQGLQLIETSAREQIENETADLQRQVGTLSSASQLNEASADDLHQRVVATREAAAALRTHWRTRQSDFSVVKGSFYLIMWLILIFADISILGQFIARFLNYDWFDPLIQQTFIQVLFSNPVVAVALFPDLFWLIASVLLMGLFIKVWLDHYFLGPASPNPHAERLPTLTMPPISMRFIIDTTFLALTILSILVIGSARVTVPLPKAPGPYPSFVSALLGVCLPLISAGFFIAGYEILARRFALWRLERLEIKTTRRTDQARREANETRTQLLALVAKRDRVASGDYQKQTLLSARAEFDKGYLEGLTQLLTPARDQSLRTLLLPIALRKALSSKSNLSLG